MSNLVKLNRTDKHPKYKERILQFGEGNFLRCFIDWQIDILNEKNGLNAGVVIARPIDTDFPPSLNTQGGVYTTKLRGYDEDGNLHDDDRLITSVNREVSIYGEYDDFLEIAKNPDLRFIFSNTTEAGIAFSDRDRFDDRPPKEFPAKLTRFLFERYQHFSGSNESGLILLPCELLDYNGDLLREAIFQYIELWNLDDAFKTWIEEANTFCSTLVDRIVTGYPADEAETICQSLGYKDDFIVTGEYFHLFVIQAPDFVADELKIANSGLNIKVVEDLKPYKNRKVGILNGSHTALVPVAFLSGIDLVKEAVSDTLFSQFIDKLLDTEIIPFLGMPEDYLKEYAASVVGRFKNPFIQHKLIDISLNSMSKFKARLLPQFIAYSEEHDAVPPLMSLSLAALISFYKGERESGEYPVKDDAQFLELYSKLWSQAEPLSEEKARTIATTILQLEEHWGTDLTTLNGLVEKVTKDMLAIDQQGMRKTLESYL